MKKKRCVGSERIDTSKRYGFEDGLKPREILERRFIFEEKRIVKEVGLQRCFEDKREKMKKKIERNERKLLKKDLFIF